jgi:hypothetical protein
MTPFIFRTHTAIGWKQSLSNQKHLLKVKGRDANMDIETWEAAVCSDERLYAKAVKAVAHVLAGHFAAEGHAPATIAVEGVTVVDIRNALKQLHLYGWTVRDDSGMVRPLMSISAGVRKAKDVAA